jgi:hypothetical protein
MQMSFGLLQFQFSCQRARHGGPNGALWAGIVADGRNGSARVAVLAIAGDEWTPALAIQWSRVYAQLRSKQRTCAVLAQLLRRRGCVRVALTVLSRFPVLARPVLRSLNANVPV